MKVPLCSVLVRGEGTAAVYSGEPIDCNACTRCIVKAVHCKGAGAAGAHAAVG